MSSIGPPPIILVAHLQSERTENETKKEFDESTSYKVALDKIRQLIVKVESGSKGANAIGPEMGSIYINGTKGKDKGLGQQQLMISAFDKICNSLLTFPPPDSTAIDSFIQFKDSVITITKGNFDTQTTQLDSLFPSFIQKLYHLIYILETLVSARDSELYFESLILKNLGGPIAFGTGSNSGRVSPLDWAKKLPGSSKLANKNVFYFKDGKYKNLMKSWKIHPFHLNTKEYNELTAAAGTTGIDRKGDPLFSENSIDDYVTLIGRDDFDNKHWYFKDDWGAENCVIYMDSVSGFSEPFYRDVVVYKDEATKISYRDKIRLIVIYELGGRKPLKSVGIENIIKYGKYFDEKFEEITLDFSTSTTYTYKKDEVTFPFSEGTLYYDSWPSYLTRYADDKLILAETAHSYLDKSGVFDYFGNKSIYEEARKETDKSKRREKTIEFLNSWHKCNRKEAIKATQELIVDHFLVHENEIEETINGFGFDELEQIVTNYISGKTNKFRKSNPLYVLRALYTQNVARTTRSKIKVGNPKSTSEDITGQTDLVNTEEVTIDPNAASDSLSTIFQSIGIPTVSSSPFVFDFNNMYTPGVVDALADTTTVQSINAGTNIVIDSIDINNAIMNVVSGNDTLKYKFKSLEQLRKEKNGK